jgi:ubiquinone biosynthesis protein UbiJ
MATKKKTKSKSKSNKKNEFNWEDFRPDWANERIDRISAELEKWNDDLQSRSTKFRKQSQKRIDRSVAQIQEELRKLPGVKRAEEFRNDLEKRVEKGVEQGVDRVYTTLKLARLDEVKKLEKKIAQLNKKLRALEQQYAA